MSKSTFKQIKSHFEDLWSYGVSVDDRTIVAYGHDGSGYPALMEFTASGELISRKEMYPST
jgi:hypothetical protein